LTKITINIYRYDPDKDQKPYMKTYHIDKPEGGKDMMLLDLLHKVREQDPSLALRRSCGEGVCGSDGMNINGTNGLACVTPISKLKQPIVIRPLPGFPVIRDLIVDMDPFYNAYKGVKPWLQNSEAPPTKERLQSPEDRAKLDGLYDCILCGCCTSACPSYWWQPDKFLGPAALLQSYRFIVDSRDDAKQERLEDLEDPYSLFRCRSIMSCATVCPKGLNPSEAIGKIRREMLDEGT